MSDLAVINEPHLKEFTEMSEYIDLEMYHKHEKQHPGYKEMTMDLISFITQESQKKDKPIKILEIGSGTGIFTEMLSQINNTHITAVEPDKNCFKWLNIHLEKIGAKNVNTIQEDGVSFRRDKEFDLAISVFAHHHIPYKNSESFVQNLFYNLKDDGKYYIGDELTAYFTNETERKQVLRDYHHHIIKLAEDDDHFELGKLEYDALLSGVRLTGDFKRSVQMVEQEMTSENLFQIEEKIRTPLKTQLPEAGIYMFSPTQ